LNGAILFIFREALMASIVALWLLAASSTAAGTLNIANANARLHEEVLAHALSFKDHPNATKQITITVEQEGELEVSVRLGREADGSGFIDAVSACSSPLEQQLRDILAGASGRNVEEISRRLSIWRLPQDAIRQSRVANLLRVADELRTSIFPIDTLLVPRAHYSVTVAGELGGSTTFNMWAPMSPQKLTGREEATSVSPLLRWCDTVVREVETARLRQRCGSPIR
jgi:hypothetical protein